MSRLPAQIIEVSSLTSARSDSQSKLLKPNQLHVTSEYHTKVGWPDPADVQSQRHNHANGPGTPQMGDIYDIRVA